MFSCPMIGQCMYCPIIGQCMSDCWIIGQSLFNCQNVQQFVSNCPMVDQWMFNFPIIGPCIFNSLMVGQRTFKGCLSEDFCTLGYPSSAKTGPPPITEVSQKWRHHRPIIDPRMEPPPISGRSVFSCSAVVGEFMSSCSMILQSMSILSNNWTVDDPLSNDWTVHIQLYSTIHNDHNLFYSCRSSSDSEFFLAVGMFGLDWAVVHHILW